MQADEIMTMKSLLMPQNGTAFCRYIEICKLKTGSIHKSRQVSPEIFKQFLNDLTNTKQMLDK